MLPPENRLKQRDTKTAKVIKKAFSEYFSITRYASSSVAPTFIFVTSAKIFKNATQRNNIKRRVRHIVRECLPNIKPGKYFFYFKKEAQELTKKDLKKEIINLIQKTQ